MKNRGQTVTLLMVEDDDVDAMAMERALRKEDVTCQLLRACDGREALDLLDAGRVSSPYLVLLDLNLPRMGGHEFLAALRADPRYASSVVFVYSTSDNPTDVARAHERHVAGYVLKRGADSDTRFVSLLRSYCTTVHMNMNG